MSKYRYPFTNELTFALVMQDPDLCKGFLQKVFPDREITMVKPHNDPAQIEKTIIADPGAKKVRLDVMFKDDSSIYDIEMQVKNEGNLPKRVRYSHGIIDVDELQPGEDYNELKPAYVIFLCCFDLYGQGKPVYNFLRYDPANKLPLGDESYTIILNSKAKEESVPVSLKSLFRYINNEFVTAGDTFIENLDADIEGWNSGERVVQIMTLEQEILIRENKARKEAFAEGVENGIKQGVTEGKSEMIKAMAAKCMNEKDIAEVSGFTIEEINAILGN